MFSRREILKIAGLVPLAGCSGINGLIGKKSKQYRRPNVVLFTSDDLGLEVGCYGDRYARTPNLDKLAAAGVRFTTAYVTQASCSPSRSSILTGLYPHQTGQVGLSHCGYSMDGIYPSIPTLLKNSGYKTGIFGKLHVLPEESFDFDVNFHDRQINIVERDIKQLSRKAVDFINDASDDPFFIMFNVFDPHRPFSDQLMGIPEEPIKPADVHSLPFLGIDNEILRKETASYYNSVTRADHALGLLIDGLREAGKYDNTLIIAIGDHGAPFTRAKTTCYEAGLRVPFIVKWGQDLPCGCVRNELVSTIDIMPTILDAAGVRIAVNLPGSSIFRLFEEDVQWRNYLCGEYTSHIQDGYFPRRAIRDGRYKLIKNYLRGDNPILGVDGCLAYDIAMGSDDVSGYVKNAYETHKSPPEYELYDLGTDPYEFRNLADITYYKNHFGRLAAALEDWQTATDDKIII